MRFIRFFKLIKAFQARVRLAVSLLQAKSGLVNLFDWERRGFPRRGFIDEAQTLTYYFHGIGCRVDTPEGPIDWDFGKFGRIDGIDLWRLGRFVQENPGIFPEFEDRDTLSQTFDLAIERGFLQPDPEDPTSTLYFLHESIVDAFSHD